MVPCLRKRRNYETGKEKEKTNWKHWLPFYLMGLPGFIYLFINNYMPLMGLQIAFKDFKYNLGIWKSPWVGLKNFEFCLQRETLRS